MMRLVCNAPTTSNRFESDRDSLPFPAGGVFGNADSSSNGSDPSLADSIVMTIEHMQSSLDDLERALGEELERELSDVLAQVNVDPSTDWPPAAA